MSLGLDLRDTANGLVDRFARFVSALRRVTPAVLLLRLLVLAGLFGGYLLAQPFTLSKPMLVAFGVSVLGALLPRARVVGLALLLIALLWLLFVPSPSLGRVLALATSLYVAHAAAAFAAVIPYDCVVSPSALGRWAGRVCGVVAISLAFGSCGILLVGQVPTVNSIIGPMVGSLLAAAIAGLLAWLLRRPASPDPSRRS